MDAWQMALCRSRSFEDLPSEVNLLPQRLQIKRHSEGSAIRIHNYGGVVVVGEGTNITKAISKSESERLLQTVPPRRDSSTMTETASDFTEADGSHFDQVDRRDSSTMTEPMSEDDESNISKFHRVTRRDSSTMTETSSPTSFRIINALSELFGHIRGKFRTQVSTDLVSSDTPERPEEEIVGETAWNRLYQIETKLSFSYIIIFV